MLPFLRTVLLTVGLSCPVAAEEVTIFAAASLGDALGAAAQVWEAETGNTVTLVLAGSATLARQIDAGAPADVFISANAGWMEWLQDRGWVLADTRSELASNTLVLVASDPALASQDKVSSTTPITQYLGTDGRLAIATPEAVPAGIYAKAALTELGQWPALAPRIAPTDSVRAALALVALGEAPLGIVYATDASAEPRVVVAGVFPVSSHPTIVYPMSVVAETDKPELAKGLLNWLTEEPAQDILAEHGFLPPRPAR